MRRNSISRSKPSTEHPLGKVSAWVDAAVLAGGNENGLSDCPAVVRQPDRFSPDVVEVIVGPVTLRFDSRASLMKALATLAPHQDMPVVIAS